MRRTIALLPLLMTLLMSACSLFVPMEKPSEEAESLLLWLPGASSVQVIADWNEWGGLVAAGGVIDPLEGSMARNDNGVWSLDISGLRPGVYRYSYFVNGYKWMKDPMNPETSLFQGRVVSVVLIDD